MGAFAFYFLQEKTTTTSNVMKIKLCFFTFLCSCWFCCVFVLNWNGIKSAYIELRRRKWYIYGCKYEKPFLRCFAQWTMEIHQRKRKQKKWNKKTCKNKNERKKNSQQLLIAHLYFVLYVLLLLQYHLSRMKIRAIRRRLAWDN